MDAGVSSKAWITKYHFGELIMREGLFGGGNARDSGEEIEEKLRSAIMRTKETVERRETLHVC